jgi:cell division septum initiation protein DivIVA
MDILRLIDQLEQLVLRSRLLPFLRWVVVEERQLLDLIDQMRVAVPQELKQARRIAQERERIIAQAKEEAERIVILAQEQASELIAQHQVVQAAEQRAALIIERAQREAERLKADADDYALTRLLELEENLSHLLQVVRNGIEKLQNERTDEPSRSPHSGARPPDRHP